MNVWSLMVNYRASVYCHKTLKVFFLVFIVTELPTENGHIKYVLLGKKHEFNCIKQL